MRGRFWIAVVVVFIAFMVVDMILHVGILSGAYNATKEIWRSEEEMDSVMWMMWLGTLVYSFFFVVVFGKGYEGKGIGEGLRYGIFIGLMFSVPMALGTYGSFPITPGIAWGWFLGGMVGNILAGILVAAVYRPARA